ncbi:MAG: hypothetical protein DIZ80_16695 [endosymbiont of Galathealinum brachiosum]|uniref:Ricin B lectin domain-containing protein n=1 Tax=endosymbiont of Galathealinum brachiosum TaxID=2200906 RepID=A0A370D8Q0_9GAMM|nr:MAG: hypothetical protein DIZ80_16695 [endosymbiont of Galathealinum brachiosum]
MKNVYKICISVILLTFSLSAVANDTRMQKSFDELDRASGHTSSSNTGKSNTESSSKTAQPTAVPGKANIESDKVYKAGGYEPANITNNSDYKIMGTISYVACKSDIYYVEPHSKWTASTNRGICLISDITGGIVSGKVNIGKINISDLASMKAHARAITKKPESKHGEKLEVTKYESEPATAYSDFRIDAFGDRYRIYSKSEFASENSRKSSTSPGFKLINDTAWPIAYSFDQVGCLAHGIVPVTFNDKQGQTIVKTGAVWFTMLLNIQPDGLDPQSASKCAEPVIEIVGDVALAVLTAGAGGAVSAAVKTGTKVAVKAAAKAAVKAGTKAAIKSIGKNLKSQLGEYLVNSGSLTMEGQYAGYDWPFRCDKMPEYRITGGPEVLKDTLGDYYLSEGNPFTVTKTNTCGNDMMTGSSKSAKAKTWKMPKSFSEAVAVASNVTTGSSVGGTNAKPLAPVLSASTVIDTKSFFRLKNRWTGEYMHVEHKTGSVELQKQVPKGWFSAMWSFVPVQGNFFRLKNRWTGEYMHIENKTGHVELQKKVTDGGWWSAQWKKIKVEGNYIRLKNRWTSGFMHNENKQGKVQVTSVLKAGGMWSAQWMLEKVR